MKTRALQTPAWVTVLAAIGIGIALAGDRARAPAVALATGPALAPSSSSPDQHLEASEVPEEDLTDADLTRVVQRTCVLCHNDQMRTADLSLQAFDVAAAAARGETAEKMIAKLRAGMMPPPGMPRPGADTLLALVERLEGKIDKAAEDENNVGDRGFQRLNRAEYERSVHELLGLEVDASKWLPLDQRQANFDNIVDVQVMSTTLLEAYLKAAGEISRLAVGDPMASTEDAQYRAARWLSQTERVEGAPMGTRGGVSVTHNFAADGEYVFRASFHAEAGGAQLGEWRSALGSVEHPEQLEISIDGERVALLDFDPWWQDRSPGVFDLTTEPIFIKAGPKRVSAAFIRRLEGPVQDLVRPHDWSAASTAIGGTYGILSLPQLRDFVIVGPQNVTGVSDHPVRERIFTCRPASPAEEGACAREIVSRLATEAYRRPVTEGELVDLFRFYEAGAKEGGFEIGVRRALTAILASPHFVFRMEMEPAGLKPGTAYPISDLALASRLSFFLWGLPPDGELERLAKEGRLSDADVLEAQVRRMLQDPRSEALATRFASQWLRLHDLQALQPSVRLHPDFHEQLREAMRRETEEFFYYLVREDRSLMEFYTADYTFVNELLARHYGFSGVVGDHFRRVQYPDAKRRGILGHASILASTSHATRTSPTIRGKWVMEVILGTPPPPPPPVPSLDETKAVAEDGRQRTTRERMEIHRAAATCRACHQYMDPIGIALEHFDVTGGYRPTDYGLPMDTRGQLYDGTPVSSLQELLDALLARPVPLVRTFTQNLMVYALGRRVEWYDKPTVRAIARQAEKNDYRMSEFILGVVKSDAFRMKRATGVTNNDH